VGFSGTRVFAVAQSPRTTPLGEALAKATWDLRSRLLRQAGWLVRQIHEAGYYLPAGDTWARRLGVVRGSENVIFSSVEPLLRGRATWQELAPAEFGRETIRLARTEQLRFLRGYLQRRHRGHRERGWAMTYLASMTKARERQAVS
jgi:hypothetical protein